MNFNELTPATIIQRIEGQNELPPLNRYQEFAPSLKLKKAAVLVPMFKQNDDWHLLYIRRSAVQDDFHSGQIAFPGGAMEELDANLEETAVRETFEEIGLLPEKTEILGRLRNHITISSFILTPIVAIIPKKNEFKLSKQEVDRVFSIPLNWLVDQKNNYLKERKINNNASIQVRYFKKYDGEILWGATARITLEFISNLLQI